jgi:integrase
VTGAASTERRRLMAAAWHRGDRDTLLVYMMTERAPLRPAEVVMLRAGDLDAPGSMIRVRGPRGERPRWRRAPAELVRRAAAYAARRRLDPASWLFPSSNPASHLSARQASRVLESVRLQARRGFFRDLAARRDL